MKFTQLDQVGTSQLAVRFRRKAYPFSADAPVTVYNSDGSVFLNTWRAWFRPGWVGDPFLEWTPIMSPRVNVSIPWLFGWTSDPFPVVDIMGTPPIQIPYDRDDDWRSYGNAISGALTGLNGTPMDLEASGENQVNHLALRGAYRTIGTGRETRAFVDIAPHSTVRLDSKQTCYVTPSQIADGSWSYALTDGNVGGVTFLNPFDAERYFTKYPPGPSVTREYGHGSTTFVYSNLGYDESESITSKTFEFAYDLNVLARAFGVAITESTYRVSYRVTTLAHPVSRLLLAGQRYTLDAAMAQVGVTVTYDEIDRVTHYKFSGYDDSLISTAVFNPQIEVNSVPELMIDRVGVVPNTTSLDALRRPQFCDLSSRHQTIEDRLRDWTEHNARELEGNYVFSASDALQQFRCDSNFLESIPELPSFLTTWKAPLQVLKDLKSASSGNLAAFLRLARSVSAAYLTYVYGIVPMESDIETLAGILTDGVFVDGSLSSLRGSAYLEVPYSASTWVGYGQVSIAFHSKAVINQQLSQFTSFLMGVEGSGLAPTPSNLWDLVPFSFVADWFVGIGEKLEALESYALYATIAPAYFVHSMRVSYYPHLLELRAAGVESTNDEPLVTYYRRRISRFLPPVRNLRPEFDSSAGNALSTNQAFSAGALACVVGLSGHTGTQLKMPRSESSSGSWQTQRFTSRAHRRSYYRSRRRR
jgi:hypothetical protein